MRLHNIQYTKIKTPISLSLIESPNETITFINQLEEYCDNRTRVYVDMKNLNFLDNSGISVLLSVVYLFKERGIKYNGNFPRNEHYKEMLIYSGFFDNLRENKSTESEYSPEKRNQIINKTYKTVEPLIGLPIQISTSKTIWGEQRVLKGLQRVLIELMHNTNNHADIYKKGEKQWWLSINHNVDERKVSFIFLDYGIGIFESLKNKPKEGKWKRLSAYLSSLGTDTSNAMLLKNLLEGTIHMSVTGHSFRGKGLPGIKEALDNKHIKNLHIVSNDVKAEVSSNNYEIIRNEFNGTFLSWELDEECINSVWTIENIN